MENVGLFWALLGALIGISAAQRKGFSVVGGVIGGLLLGPLAFLMFLCSGNRKNVLFAQNGFKKKQVSVGIVIKI